MIRELARRAPGFTWVAAFTILALVAIGTRLGAPVQPVLVIIVVLTCPGFLLIDLTQPKDLQARIMLGIGASIAFNLVLVNLVLVLGAVPLTLAVAAVLIIVGIWKRAPIAEFIASLRFPMVREPARVVAYGGFNESRPDRAAHDPAVGEPNEPTDVHQPHELDEAPENIADNLPPVLVLGIDINRADAEELATLPEVKPEMAQRIVANRGEQGAFASADDLLHLLVQLASDAGTVTRRNLDSVDAPAFAAETEEDNDDTTNDLEAGEVELPPTGKR